MIFLVGHSKTLEKSVEPIKSIFNTCLQERRIPESWKKVKITPIPKGNCSQISEPKQMRQMTPAMLKILEYYIRKYLNYIEKDLDKQQYAYKKRISTVEAITQLITKCSDILDQTNSIVRILFLDYSSAFNTINRQHVINIIAKNINTPKWLVEWFMSYLSERQQYITLGKTKSKILPSNTGVIQGAVLSPFLFTLVTDSMRSGNTNATIIKFADDTAVIQALKTKDDLKDYKSTIDYITDFSAKNNLILNIDKTHELILKNRNFDNNLLTSEIIIDNKAVKYTNQAKYLGITIDHKLNFKPHIQSIVSHVRRKMFYAKRLIKNCRQNIVVKDFITTCIIPVITYGLHIYIHFINKESLGEIKKLLRHLACMCGLTDNYFVSLVQNQINNAAKKMADNISNNKNHPLYEIAEKPTQDTHMILRSRGGILPRTNKSIGQKNFIYQSIKASVQNKQYFSFSD
ncbi:Uncharacterised protein at_DN2678 [Pycnogonum litorale]